MEQMLIDIEKITNKTIKRFINTIHTKYDIDRDELANIWVNLGKECENSNTPDTAPVSNTVSTTKVKQSQISDDRLIRKHLNTNRFWHPKSRLVFESGEDRVVIGKMGNDNVLDLTESDIEECVRLKFPYRTKK